MRLTLRTLLAWLDDTLLPSEVREIGRQVGDSPFAKELVERIHKVTRQRRLSVPPRSGTDAIDPNIVAAYLDNELDSDLVAEVEKKCLVSDVHLAEVASSHQILSLIGQKAKVPVEARHRMYQLVKGRESVKPRAPRASLQSEPKPVAEPVQPWVTPPLPPRPWYERFGPVAAVIALISILGWSAWRSLTPPTSAPNMSIPLAANETSTAKEKKPEVSPLEAEAKALAAERNPAAVTVAENNAAKTATEETKKNAEKPEKPANEIPAGSAGLAKKPSGLLLRYNTKNRDWDRLTDATPLSESDRLLSLAPFRATLEIGSANVELLGETEVVVRSTPPSLAARLSLSQGQAILHGTNPSLPFEIQFGSKTITVVPPPGAVVGIERINRRGRGIPIASEPALRFYASEPSTTIKSNSGETTLDAAGAATVESDGKLTDQVSKAPPEWVTSKEPSDSDKKVGEPFLKFFRADRPIVSSLVEASEDPDKEICQLAITALRAVGDVSYIVPLLNKKGDPSAAAARIEAISVLRQFLDQGPDSAKILREQLERDLGEDLAPIVEKQLVGYTPKDAVNDATYVTLVQYLGDTTDSGVGLRQLALENLKQITGRGDLEYDPEKPEGKGLKAWRDFLRDRLAHTAAKKAEK